MRGYVEVKEKKRRLVRRYDLETGRDDDNVVKTANQLVAMNFPLGRQ